MTGRTEPGGERCLRPHQPTPLPPTRHLPSSSCPALWFQTPAAATVHIGTQARLCNSISGSSSFLPSTGLHAFSKACVERLLPGTEQRKNREQNCLSVDCPGPGFLLDSLSNLVLSYLGSGSAATASNPLPLV